MPKTKILEISTRQQAWMLREVRRCRYGHLLGLQILLLLARGKSPTEIADFMLCSRASVYRTQAAWERGQLPAQWWPTQPVREAAGRPPLTRFQRLLRWLVQQPPRTFGWCRTRWSCAALALTITARIGLSYSRETVRRELHSQG